MKSRNLFQRFVPRDDRNLLSDCFIILNCALLRRSRSTLGVRRIQNLLYLWVVIEYYNTCWLILDPSFHSGWRIKISFENSPFVSLPSPSGRGAGGEVGEGVSEATKKSINVGTWWISVWKVSSIQTVDTLIRCSMETQFWVPQTLHFLRSEPDWPSEYFIREEFSNPLCPERAHILSLNWFRKKIWALIRVFCSFCICIPSYLFFLYWYKKGFWKRLVFGFASRKILWVRFPMIGKSGLVKVALLFREDISSISLIFKACELSSIE